MLHLRVFLDDCELFADLQYALSVSGSDVLRDLDLPGWQIDGVVAMGIDDVLLDLKSVIFESCDLKFITVNSAKGLEIIRHDAAHVMAQALKELFPGTMIAIGPTIKDGFFYDFVSDATVSENDFALIESKMQNIIDSNFAFSREVWSRTYAESYFLEKGEQYKVKILHSIPENEEIFAYRQGDFVDMCRGPHSPSTGYIKAFKLLKVSGSYWLGDSANDKMQRIYGTAWKSKADLELHLHMLEEASRRDHRKLGRELDLFHLQGDEAGQVFWHAKGCTLYRVIEDYMRDKLLKHGYFEVKTPLILSSDLWKTSGHWDKFQHNMYLVLGEGSQYAIKPMSCPCHIAIFNSATRSYRDLPMRMSEFGICHRNEVSGSLFGLMRTRAFTQDDAHIFCTEDQIVSEVAGFYGLLRDIYSDFGFNAVKVRFSDRPAVRAGDSSVWDKAETALKGAVDVIGLECISNPGEGAFYGPKLEFVLEDALGRDWQCGTIQVDFVLPERFGATYTGSDGVIRHPVMLHRAVLGTFERFIGILIEHCAGEFPVWLAPIQVCVLPVVSSVDYYADQVYRKLLDMGARAILDIGQDRVGYKVRKYISQKIPEIWVVGPNEANSGSVSVRKFGDSVGVERSFSEAASSLLDGCVFLK